MQSKLAQLVEALHLLSTHAPPAVLFLNLDHFEVINDSLGPQAGSQLLDIVERRLKECVRPTDLVARLDRDQFAIVLPNAGGADHARAVAERIAERLRAASRVGGHEVSVTASIGIALGGEGVAAEDLVRNADIAMYQAKQDGKDHYRVFDGAMRTRAWEGLRLEADLRRAIEREEFRLHYQPIVDLATGHSVGAEALVRWEHPQQGLVAPASFVPAAERSGLIIGIGEWVLAEACTQAAAWRDMPLDGSPGSVSVNVSARQLERSDEFVALVRKVLEQSCLPPGQLKLEITESAVMRDPELAVATLWALKGLGVHLVVDDFGTGYSSLAYLKRFPVDTLKIDRSFVEGLPHLPEDRAIVAAIVAFARTLGLNTVAEGIESDEQAAELHEIGCDLGQGYLFGKPRPAADRGLARAA